MATTCKCKKTECEECPEWIFTFADLVMLMMGFFVILWVLKPSASPKAGEGDAQAAAAQGSQWTDAVIGIRQAFDYKPDPNSHDPIDIEMIKRARGKKQGAENIRPRTTPPGTDQNVTSVRPGKQTIVGSRLMFDAGSPQLTPESIHALDEIAEKIRGHYAIVLIKGHAALDDLPEGVKGQQPMDLSLRRAQAVADYMMSKGVAPDVLRVQGCSTFEPVHQRTYTSNGQADNRRVEVEWTAELLDDRQDRSNVPTAPLNEKPTAGSSKENPRVATTQEKEKKPSGE